VKTIRLLVIIFSSVIALSAWSQQSPTQPPLPIRPPMSPEALDSAELEEIQRKLEAAQQRLDEAAREVAEHSAQLYQEHIPRLHQIRIERFGGGNGAMLGVHIEEAKDSKGNRVDGVQVVGVTPGGPADEAGIKNGDKIVAVNGQSLQWQDDESPARQLFRTMSEVKPEEHVTVDYVREGQANSVIVATQKMNGFQLFGESDFDFDFDFDVDIDEDKMRAIEDKFIVLNDGIKSMYSFSRQPWHELELMTLTPKLGSYFNVDKGILVVSIGDNDKLALEEGDVIVSIDGRQPNDPAHAIRILSSYQPGETVNFEIMRDRNKRTVKYTIEENNKDVSFHWQPGEGNLSNRSGMPGVQIIPLGNNREVVKYITLDKEDSI